MSDIASVRPLSACELLLSEARSINFTESRSAARRAQDKREDINFAARRVLPESATEK